MIIEFGALTKICNGIVAVAATQWDRLPRNKYFLVWLVAKLLLEIVLEIVLFWDCTKFKTLLWMQDTVKSLICSCFAQFYVSYNHLLWLHPYFYLNEKGHQV